MAEPDRTRQSTERPVPVLEPLGDSAWLLRFGTRLDPTVNATVHECAVWLASRFAPGQIECVPAFASLALHFDPERDPAAVRIEIDRALDAWLARGNTAILEATVAPRTLPWWSGSFSTGRPPGSARRRWRRWRSSPTGSR